MNALFRLLDPADTLSSQVLGELGQGGPFRGLYSVSIEQGGFEVARHEGIGRHTANSLVFVSIPMGQESLTGPALTVHVYMFLVVNVILVEVVYVHLFLAVACAQQLQEVFLELVAVVVDEFLGIFADQQHLTHLRRVSFRSSLGSSLRDIRRLRVTRTVYAS